MNTEGSSSDENLGADFILPWIHSMLRDDDYMFFRLWITCGRCIHIRKLCLVLGRHSGARRGACVAPQAKEGDCQQRATTAHRNTNFSRNSTMLRDLTPSQVTMPHAPRTTSSPLSPVCNASTGRSNWARRCASLSSATRCP